ncbi:MAG: MBL fold metallo-hydrolase [bacterium]
MQNEFGAGKGKASILLSHPHWDHIQGFPFFTPMYVKGNKFTVYGKERESVPLKEIFSGQTKNEYFPVPFSRLNADIRFMSVNPGESFGVFGLNVTTARGNHPGISIGYRLQEGNKSLVYISDTAPFRDLLIEDEFIADPDEAIVKNRERIDEINRYQMELCRLFNKADLLIYDTFFTPQDYLPHYGHATFNDAIDMAFSTGVKHLICFHHKPDRTDKALDLLSEHYKTIIGKKKLAFTIAREGMEIIL